MTRTATATVETAAAPPPSLLKFNLSLAMAGEPLVTRDGRVATRFIASQDRSTNYPIRATIDGKEQSFTIAGSYWIGRPDPMDLFMYSLTGIASHDIVTQSPPCEMHARVRHQPVD